MAWGQEIQRIEIAGQVFSEKGEELEGIHIYNYSSQRGTITSAQGEFKLLVAANDRLQVSSLQYATLNAIVTQEVIEVGKIQIYLNPYINELSEVFLSNINLSGDLERDVKDIPVFVVPEIDVSPAAIASYEFERDSQSPIQGNAAEAALGVNNVPMASIDLGKLFESIFSSKKAKLKKQKRSSGKVYDVLTNRYSVEFYVENFKIPEEKVLDFIYFVEDHLEDEYLLNPEDEIQLIAYITTLSEAYKKRM
ncbi:MAG: carboxypeptidase-like regulatory domain-containing protein [Flavobacteriaceae bacterium]|nr:carboxypeptidase-like regulatory domain-containing protein [Flavobacteriaceae bacterium]